MDNTGHVVAYDRYSGLDWTLQLQRISNLAKQYRARTLIDSTGVGDPILDALRRHNVNVSGYKFTSASKADLIENLSLKMDKDEISYPNIPELISELQLYGYTTSAGGTVKYGAPEGYHDDIVISLALAAWQLRRGPLIVGRANVPW
jgi:hypothetical protein